MTAGTRHNSTSKFGPFGHHADEAFGGYPAGAGFPGDGFPGDGLPDHESDARQQTDPGREPKRGRKAERYSGRHASPRGKTTRKWRVGKVVPAAAVAATLAAGTAAAYALGAGGQPHAAQLNDALNAAMTLPGQTAAAAALDAGKANSASSSLVRVAQATAKSGTHAAAQTAAAKPAASGSPSASPAAAKSQTAAPRAAATTPTPTATPTATPSASQPAAAGAATLSCNLSYGILPQNVTAIVSFLLANGYSDNAAAGIAGNIYQESKGDPESIGTGGGGLIGWTPLPSGFVTGDVSADLQTQLKEILVYNQGWASYLPALNAAGTPADAAYIYVTDFERAGIPAASTRETSADDVASACGI